MARHLFGQYLPHIANTSPDEGIVLAELLETRGIRVAPSAWKALAARRPTLTLSLLQRCGAALADGLFAGHAAALSTSAVTALATLAPRALGRPEDFWPSLTEESRAAFLDAWSTHLRTRPQWLVDGGLLHWGLGLIAQLPPSDAREFAYQRWSEGARHADGTIALDAIARLPEDLRVREGRRHLYDVLALRAPPPRRARPRRPIPRPRARAQARARPRTRPHGRRPARVAATPLAARAHRAPGPDRARHPRRVKLLGEHRGEAGVAHRPTFSPRSGLGRGVPGDRLSGARAHSRRDLRAAPG